MIEDSSRKWYRLSRLTQTTLSKAIIIILNRGSVTLLSKNTKYDKKENAYKISDRDKHILCPIEGEFTQHIKFEGNSYWQFQADAYPALRRMAFTLPSDSTFREDLIWWKKGDEDAAQRYKVKLEEIQRNEKKLREQNSKKK